MYISAFFRLRKAKPLHRFHAAGSDPCIVLRTRVARARIHQRSSSPTHRRTLQVFLTTLDLLDAALVSIGACKEARHNHVVAALEPTVATLLKKQGDGQARLRDGAMNGLVAVARCRTAGPVFVRCALNSLAVVALPKDSAQLL